MVTYTKGDGCRSYLASCLFNCHRQNRSDETAFGICFFFERFQHALYSAQQDENFVREIDFKLGHVISSSGPGPDLVWSSLVHTQCEASRAYHPRISLNRYYASSGSISGASYCPRASRGRPKSQDFVLFL